VIRRASACTENMFTVITVVYGGEYPVLLTGWLARANTTDGEVHDSGARIGFVRTSVQRLFRACVLLSQYFRLDRNLRKVRRRLNTRRYFRHIPDLGHPNKECRRGRDMHYSGRTTHLVIWLGADLSNLDPVRRYEGPRSTRSTCFRFFFLVLL